jgi:ribosome biogenesis GTPase / thiamine phosphate phosphatase
LKTGKVIKSTGSWYKVMVENRDVIDCRIIGKFRMDNMIITNPVAVGDMVDFEIEDEGKGIIKKIHTRRNFVARQSPREKNKIHLLASNLDQALLFVTIVEPKIKQGFIDRFLLTTEPRDIPTIIVFNKADIYDDDAMLIYKELYDIYTKIGYDVMLISALTGEGVEALRLKLKGKTTLISGQSGVGKSSTMNALDKELELHTIEISDYTGKGQHTTTFAELYQLAIGGEVIDTPGIKMLAFNNMEVMDVMHNFREYFKYAENCKFANCTHRKEPNCAVKLALEAGEISLSRYNSYVQILVEIEDQNYWERHGDF